MARVRVCSFSVSLDGYGAGPDQSETQPLGVGGNNLHDWAFATSSIRRQFGMTGGDEGMDDEWVRRGEQGIGATIMGRNMFGPIRGEWPDEQWKGWWGDDPPFHHPVFILTHHPRPSVPMPGGTTFHFVTGGIREALERALHAAEGRDVRIGGGAATIRQYLDADLIDDLHMVIVPVLLGSGERLFEGSGRDLPERYQCAEFASSPAVTHVRLSRRTP